MLNNKITSSSIHVAKTATSVSVKDICKELEIGKSHQRQLSKAEQIGLARERLPAFLHGAKCVPTDTWSLPCFSRPGTQETIHGSRPSTRLSILDSEDNHFDNCTSNIDSRPSTRERVLDSRPSTQQSERSAHTPVNGPDVEQDLMYSLYRNCPDKRPPSLRTCHRAHSVKSEHFSNPTKPAFQNVRSLPRQCCDVLGPRLCTECSSLSRRNRDASKYEISYPDIEASPDNFATLFVVQRHSPNLTLQQIQQNIALGGIKRKSFQDVLEKIRYKARQAETGATTNKNERKNVFLFTTFTQLKDKFKVTTPGTGTSVSTSVSYSPIFVSDRQSKKKNRRPNSDPFKLFFKPPLISKVRQNTDPTFFAGSDKPYKLPDRLPDEVEDDDY